MDQNVAGSLILILTGLATYSGLKRSSFQDEYKFEVDAILKGREYQRLLSSGFLHVGRLHFAFNMGALISFAWSLERLFGIGTFLFVYFISMLGGSLFALYIHRNHGDYSAVGASGAVSGVIAASILLFPFSEIGLIGLPGGITGWMVGLAIIFLSILGIKSQAGNIGHEAHLGGIITGILATVVLEPYTVMSHWWVLLLLTAPIALFIYLISTRPEILITNKWNLPAPPTRARKRKSVSVDDVLDKIRASGVDSLTKRERRVLEEFRDGN